MKQISSEPKLETFSPLVRDSSDFSNSELMLPEKGKMCSDTHSGIKNKLILNDSSEIKSISMANEETCIKNKESLTEDTSHPDGGWGWVVCAACFMGKITIIL